MKKIILYLICISSFSQSSIDFNISNPNLGCFDDDYTISIGMSLYDSSILNCQDAILYLNNFGYGCTTSLSQINNPFWGSNPNETIANICSCTCDSSSDIYGCVDPFSCNYNSEATVDDGSCIYPEFAYDCSGFCLNDEDSDGICDEFDNCNYNEILVSVQGLETNFGWNISGDGGWAVASGDIGTYQFCIEDGCWDFNMYGNGDGWNETYLTISYLESNEIIHTATLSEGNFCGTQIQIGSTITCLNIFGCVDMLACNYNCSANADDGSCIYPDNQGECSDECVTDLDQDGICDDICNDFDLLVVDCECSFLDPETYTVFFTDVDEDNCIIIDDCYCECISDIDGDGICDEVEIAGCTDSESCFYDFSATQDDGSCIYPGDECIAGVLEGGGLIYGIYDDNCMCIQSNISINENLINKKVIKVINVLGREVFNDNIIIKIYDDGSTEKQLFFD